MGKAVSPVTNRVAGLGSFAKEKLIDQKITHREKPTEHGGVSTGGTGGGSNEGSSSASASAEKADSSKRWISAKPSGAMPKPADGSEPQASTQSKTDFSGRVPPKPLSTPPAGARTETAAGKADTQGERAVSAGGARVSDQATSQPQSSSSNANTVKPDGPVKSFLAATRAKLSDVPLTTAADGQKPDAAGGAEPQAGRNDTVTKAQTVSDKVEKDQTKAARDEQPKVGDKKVTEEQRKDSIPETGNKEDKKETGTGGQPAKDDKQPRDEGKRNDPREQAQENKAKIDKDQGRDQGAPQGDKQQNADVNKEQAPKEGEGLKPQGNQQDKRQPHIDPDKAAPSGGKNQTAGKPDDALKANNPAKAVTPKKPETLRNPTNKGNS
jgi:hypothetical protein